MNKNALFFAGLLLLFFTNCDVEVDDPNHAAQIEGTYVMQAYETQSGASVPSADDKVIIERVSDETVNLTIDYAIPSANDVVLDGMTVTKNGDDFLLERTFSNGEASGEVAENILTLNINYSSGTYAIITAEK